MQIARSIRSVVSGCAAASIVALALNSAVAQTPAASYADGQKIEVREGDTWSPATIVKKEGRRYQIKYDDGTEEWVTIERMRAQGDAIGAEQEIPTVGGDGKTDTAKPDTAKPDDGPAKPKVLRNAQFALNTRVEVKKGGSWDTAIVNKKQGEWTLVTYVDTKWKEWVEPWRIRKVGSKDDTQGFARWNSFVRGQEGPPRELPGEPDEENRGPVDKDNTAAYKALPEYKEANLKGAPAATMLGPVGGKWTLVVSPAMQPANPAPTRPAVLKGAAAGQGANVKAIRVARADPAAVFVEHGGGSDVRIEKLDAGTGRSLAVHTLANETALVEVSPDGKQMLIRSNGFHTGQKNRIEVWDCDGPAAKRTLVFFPYAGDWHERDVDHAMFVDPGHILTIGGKNDGLVLWDLATGKAVYTFEGARTLPAISPDGTLLAIAAGDTIFLCNPLTGDLTAQLTGAASPQSLSFSPSGRFITALGNKMIRQWDLSTGTLHRAFSVASTNLSKLTMISDTHGLADGQVLIDFALRLPLWKYTFGSGATEVDALGRCWFAGADDVSKQTLLSTAALPHAEAARTAEVIAGDDLMLLKPGAKVALSVNVSGDPQQVAKVTEALKKQIADNRFVLDDAAKIRIAAATRQGESKQMTYQTMHGAPWNREQQTVTVTSSYTSLTIEADGKVAWESQVRSGGGSPILHMRQGQTIEQAANAGAGPNLHFLQNVQIPAYLGKPRDPAWYGSSKVTPRGITNE